MYPEKSKCASVQSRIFGSPGPNVSATTSLGFPTKIDRSRIRGYVAMWLDHLGVVVVGEERFVVAAVWHREEADEVGEPDVRAAFELRVLVPEVIDVPRLVPDDEVVQPLLHDLLEQHEVGNEDLVHAAERLEAMQVVTARLRSDVRRLGGEPVTCRVNRLARRSQRSRHRVLREPIDLEVR